MMHLRFTQHLSHWFHLDILGVSDVAEHGERYPSQANFDFVSKMTRTLFNVFFAMCHKVKVIEAFPAALRG